MQRFFSLLLIVLVIFAFSGCSSNEEKKIAHFEKGKAYLEKQEFQSARLEFKNAIKLDPRFSDAYWHLAEASLKLNDPKEAFGAYSMVVMLNPENIEAQIKVATFLLLGRKIEQAREKVDLILTKDPNNSKALLL
ncbi:MAG: hypothetical protein COW41_04965, partial [Deltaproteobacteria bacterium CG17_big_fil_post_rev_8_21_14_2_50_51_6]